MDGGLGFRDLEAFNKAFIAKKAWKCLVSLDIIFSHYFKEAYFSLFFPLCSDFLHNVLSFEKFGVGEVISLNKVKLEGRERRENQSLE